MQQNCVIERNRLVRYRKMFLLDTEPGEASTRSVAQDL